MTDMLIVSESIQNAWPPSSFLRPRLRLLGSVFEHRNQPLTKLNLTFGKTYNLRSKSLMANLHMMTIYDNARSTQSEVNT